MDVNYSRWMSRDPDEPEVIDDEPGRFRLRWPNGSAVAGAAMVSLILLGGAAYVRSLATSEVSTDQVQTVDTQAADESSESDSASDEDTYDDETYDDATYDDGTYDTYDDVTPDGAAGVTPADDSRAPDEMPLMDRREFRQSDGVPPGGPLPSRPLRAHRHSGERVYLVPPMPRP